MSSAITLGSMIIGKLHEIKTKDQRLAQLKIKLHLFLSALYIYHDKEAQLTFNAINAENEAIEKNLMDVPEESTRNGFMFSAAYTKTFFFYKMKKGRYPQGDRFVSKGREERFHNVAKTLKDVCEPILKKLDHNFDVERAQVVILACKTIISAKRGKIEPKFKEKLKHCIACLSKSDCKRLEMQANYLFAKIQLQYYLNLLLHIPDDKIKKKKTLSRARKKFSIHCGYEGNSRVE